MERTRIPQPDHSHSTRTAQRAPSAAKGQAGEMAVPGAFLSLLSGAGDEAWASSQAPGSGVLGSVGQRALDADRNDGENALIGMGVVGGGLHNMSQWPVVPPVEGNSALAPAAGSWGIGDTPAEGGHPSPASTDLAALFAGSVWSGRGSPMTGLVAQTAQIDAAPERGTREPLATVPQRGMGKSVGAAALAAIATPLHAKPLPRDAALTGDGASTNLKPLPAPMLAAPVHAINQSGQGRDALYEIGGVRLTEIAGGAAAAQIIGLSAGPSKGGEQMRGDSGAGPRQGSDGANSFDAPGDLQARIESASERFDVAADASAHEAQDAIAEQVTYWLTENLKNAQLTVDHEGLPVGVRVSLAGNEAHVAFRSDEAGTREMLDAHIADLQELLQREGFVLAGVTVDSQAAGHSPHSGGNSPKEGRRTTQVVAGAVEAHLVGKGGVGASHAGKVDIFV